MLLALRPERGAGAPLEMKGQRVCDWLGVSREDLEEEVTSSDLQLHQAHMRLSRFADVQLGTRVPHRKKGADTVVEAGRCSFAVAPVEESCEAVWNVNITDDVRSSRGLRE